MQVEIKPLKTVFIITDRDLGSKVINTLNDNNFSLHNAFLGRGTAPSEISTLFGVGEKEKSIIVMVTSEEHISNLFDILKNDFGIGNGNGIAFSISINSVSNLKAVNYILGLN